MSERKVINKYFPPDFDPSKIKRRKMGKQTQQTVRLMAPFSMRCNRCGEYVYKGKKFNARKETAEGEEYYGIKVFRFYIKCPTCSSEITFKTDPKNADYICEQGATRNFENWTDAVDPTGRTKALPGAEQDDEYDSDGNLKEDAKERNAMEDLERAQEQSRREMEMMDELSDLRQRNARLELSNANADPEALLAALHAERETAEQERRRQEEEAEDEAELAKYFSHVRNGTGNGKGKGKEKAVVTEQDLDPTIQDGVDPEYDSGSGDEGGLLDLTIKRRPPPGSGADGEPTVATLLAAKGKVLDTPVGNGSTSGASTAASSVQQVKRKREGMQKLLGIKKKK